MYSVRIMDYLQHSLHAISILLVEIRFYINFYVNGWWLKPMEDYECLYAACASKYFAENRKINCIRFPKLGSIKKILSYLYQKSILATEHIFVAFQKSHPK